MRNTDASPDIFLADVQRCYKIALENGLSALADLPAIDVLAANVGTALAGLRMSIDNVPDSQWKPTIYAYFESIETANRLDEVDPPSGIFSKADGAGAILRALQLLHESFMFLKHDMREEAWDSMCTASFWQGMVARQFLTDLYPSDERRKLAQSAALARVANSSKQKAKMVIEQRYLQWQTGGSRYRSGADFARQMALEFPVIQSTRTITAWTTGWRKKRSRS